MKTDQLIEQWDARMAALSAQQIQGLLGCEERTAYYYKSGQGRPKPWQIKIYLDWMIKGGGSDNRAAKMLEARRILEKAVEILSE